MVKKKTQNILVQHFTRAGSDKCISIQFPEKGYFTNKWLSIEEAKKLAEDILLVLKEGKSNAV